MATVTLGHLQPKPHHIKTIPTPAWITKHHAYQAQWVIVELHGTIPSAHGHSSHAAAAHVDLQSYFKIGACTHFYTWFQITGCQPACSTCSARSYRHVEVYHKLWRSMDSFIGCWSLCCHSPLHAWQQAFLPFSLMVTDLLLWPYKDASAPQIGSQHSCSCVDLAQLVRH